MVYLEMFLNPETYGYYELADKLNLKLDKMEYMLSTLNNETTNNKVKFRLNRMLENKGYKVYFR
jgi:hypothetical protein